MVVAGASGQVGDILLPALCRLGYDRIDVDPGQLTTALTGLVEIDPPESMVQSEMQSQAENMARQLQMQGIDFQAWMSATGQTPQQFIEATRPR